MTHHLTADTDIIISGGGSSDGLFNNLVSIKRATPSFFANNNGNLGSDITGSELIDPEIASSSGVLRLVINDTGVVKDTESPNNFTFSDSGTMISFGWSQSVVLVFYKFEYYDNSAGERTLFFGLYADSGNIENFTIRHDFNMPTSNYTFKHLSGYAGYISIENYHNYYIWFMSNGGGKIRNIEFMFIRSNLSF